jgi:hypothetical protein
MARTWTRSIGKAAVAVVLVALPACGDDDASPAGSDVELQARTEKASSGAEVLANETPVPLEGGQTYVWRGMGFDLEWTPPDDEWLGSTSETLLYLPRGTEPGVAVVSAIGPLSEYRVARDPMRDGEYVDDPSFVASLPPVPDDLVAYFDSLPGVSIVSVRDVEIAGYPAQEIWSRAAEVPGDYNACPQFGEQCVFVFLRRPYDTLFMLEGWDEVDWIVDTPAGLIEIGFGARTGEDMEALLPVARELVDTMRIRVDGQS